MQTPRASPGAAVGTGRAHRRGEARGKCGLNQPPVTDEEGEEEGEEGEEDGENEGEGEGEV